MPYIGRAPTASITKLEDADQDTKIQVEESSDEDIIRFDIAGAEDFTMTANTLTALSGSTIKTNTIAETTGASGVTVDGMIIKDGGLTIASGKTLAVASGGAITNSGTATGFGMDSESAYAGVLEANATFVDQAIFGPSVDGQAWNGKWSVASLYSSLMLVTIEDAGADTEVNIWDLTEVSSSAPSTTPLGTVTLSGDATPTSVAACMGYIIVGSEDGISIIDPHSGSWAERTAGWPRSLSTSTTPALTDNDVQSVAAGFSDQPPFDPRTGGSMPCFAVVHGAGADASALIKDDGNVYDRAIPSGSIGFKGVAIGGGRVFYAADEIGKNVVNCSPLISTITADDYTDVRAMRVDDIPYGFGGETELAMRGNDFVAASAEGVSFSQMPSDSSGAGSRIHAIINRTFNSGFYTQNIKGIWLSNSATADRSFKANTLTETGTVTEAAVESGTELLGYSGFDASNYLSRASDADWDVITTGSAYLTGWFKSSGNSGVEALFGFGNSGETLKFNVRLDTSGTVTFLDRGADAQVALLTTGTYDDGAWHKLDCVRVSSTDRYLYIDGELVLSSTTNAGSLTGSGTLPFSVGIHSDLSSSPSTTSTISLVRLSTTAPSATQIRQMYDAEKGMFVASAECLLQSGSTDAVLDVDVDPLTGKVLVTQTDAITIFDGLAVDSKPTVNSGSSEKGKLWGDLRAEQNSANAYVTAPAVDQRQVNEMVRGLANDMPAGVDLSKAKAWIKGTMPSTITSSYNIESLATVSTGQATVTFGVPFKNTGYIVAGCSGTGYDRFLSSYDTYTTAGTARLTLYRHTTGLTQDGIFFAVFFGELENE